MGDVKHTPGPWKVYVNNQQGYALGVLASGEDDYRAGNECLCEVRDPHGYEGGVPEAEANARLISAAPDMADAIRFCLANAGGPPVDMLSRLRAALLKATGECL